MLGLPLLVALMCFTVPEPARRVQARPVRPGDLWRVVRAERRYLRGYRRLYEDYPPELWRT